jgi:hypothetical protein
MLQDQAETLLVAGTMTSLTPQAMEEALDAAASTDDLAALTAACINKSGYVEDSLNDFEEPCPEYESCRTLSQTWYALSQKAARALCGRTGRTDADQALEACGYRQSRGWWIKDDSRLD